MPTAATETTYIYLLSRVVVPMDTGPVVRRR